MNRFVVMVDAGYLLRQAIEIVSKRASKKRAELGIPNPSDLIALLIAKSKEMLNLDDKELLRVYWYDGMMSNGLTPQQRDIVEVDDVQFRAGTVNANKQQKGVDSLIVTDLIELTTHHAICDAILVTGDSDLAVGIELAQKRGVRIAVLGLEDMSIGLANHQSFEITSRADRVGRLGAADIGALFSYNPAASNVVPLPKQSIAAIASIQEVGSIAQVAVAIATASTLEAPAKAATPDAELVVPARQLTEEDREAISALVSDFVEESDATVASINPVTARIERDVDRKLLFYVFDRLKRGRLTDDERAFVREAFRERLA